MPSEFHSSAKGKHSPVFFVPLEGGSVENIALDSKFQELVRAFHSIQRELQEKWEKYQTYYQRWELMGSLSPILVSLVAHHWGGSGLSLRNFRGLRP